MTKPETKTVLGRVFTLGLLWVGNWSCRLTPSLVLSLYIGRERVQASLYDDERDVELAYAYGPTEADAILALQATLRKMAELEVVE